MKELILGLFVILMLAQNASAQKRTVIGTVKAQEEGLPLADVTIKIFGALKDSVTNSDGGILRRINIRQCIHYFFLFRVFISN